MPSVKFSGFEEYFTGFCPHLCLYSWNGCGKTTLAGKTGLRTILIDCGDAGVVTLRDADRKKLKIIRIQSTLHYLDTMDEIKRLSDKFDLLVVDTLTGLQSMAIKEVKGRRGEMNQRKWGQAGSKVIECISETRMFLKDIIYLAQEKRKSRDEGEGTVQIIAPSLMPSVREYLSSCVDWVGRLYLEDKQRKLSFVLSDTIEAKDRATLFPKPIAIPDVKEKALYPAIRKRIIESVHA